MYILNLLNNHYFSGILCGILSVILFIIDSKITRKPKEKKEYIKIFVITGVIVGTLIYLINIGNVKDTIRSSKIGGDVKSSVQPIVNSMSNSDLPDF